MNESTAREAQEDLRRLMGQLREGSAEAAREILEKYGDALLRVIRRRLEPELRTHYDSADFAQDVWASFFRGCLQEYQFDSPEQLMGFLANLAAHKVCDATRARLFAQKRNENRVHSLDGSAAAAVIHLAGPEPTPSQVVLAKEQWDRLLDNPLPHHRCILELLRAGYSQADVARRLGLPVKRVRRTVQRVLRMLQAEASP